MKKLRHQRPAYAQIAVTLASTKRVLHLSAPEKRLLAYLNVQYRPGKPIVLPIRNTAEALKVKPTAVTAALNGLILAGLVERTKAHVPPSSRGKGRAAEYRLVHRKGSKFGVGHDNQRTETLAVLDHGDEVRIGFIKLLSADLLTLTADLSNAEFDVVWAAGFRNHARDKYGAITDAAAMALSGLRQLLPRAPPRTLSHTVQSLIRRGLLVEVAPAAGRRSMVIAPAGIIANGLPWGKHSRRSQMKVHKHESS